MSVSKKVTTPVGSVRTSLARASTSPRIRTLCNWPVMNPTGTIRYFLAASPVAGAVGPGGGGVEPLVHAPQAVNPPLVRRVGVVNDAVLERERAHAGPFLPVRLPVRSNARRESGDEGIVLAALRQP